MSEFDQLSASVLRDALLRAPIGIGLADKNGRFFMISEALAGLLERPEEEIIGRTFLSFVHPHDRARSVAEYFEAVAAAAAGLPNGSKTIRCETGTGRSVLVDVSWTAIEADRAGRGIAVIYLAAHPAPVAPDRANSRPKLQNVGTTTREAQVLDLVIARFDNVEIAARLHISKRTVESHLAALLRKFAVPNRRALRRAVGRTGEKDGIWPILSSAPSLADRRPLD
jgi:PAS domain S-box-containing protein